MQDLTLIKFVMYGLCFALAISINSAVYYGCQTHKSRLYFPKHKGFVIASTIVIVLIIVAVEGFIRPHLQRHFSPLLNVHISLCLALVIVGVSAAVFHGKRSNRHKLFGWLTWLFGNLVWFTGALVTH